MSYYILMWLVVNCCWNCLTSRSSALQLEEGNQIKFTKRGVPKLLEIGMECSPKVVLSKVTTVVVEYNNEAAFGRQFSKL